MSAFHPALAETAGRNATHCRHSASEGAEEDVGVVTPERLAVSFSCDVAADFASHGRIVENPLHHLRCGTDLIAVDHETTQSFSADAPRRRRAEKADVKAGAQDLGKVLKYLPIR